jgi:valyl-tRNA synthetase
LWPFSVFGWPEQTPDLKYYYPTTLLITGFDILFFWVARMAMFGMKFMKDVPFRDVYIHGLVRDEHGHKMSKTRGNALDPFELINEYGADALRFTFAILAVPGPDIPLAPKRVQGYKAFLNKLWNSMRFALMKVNPAEDLTPLPEDQWDICDRWITSRLNRVAGEINDYLREYRFDLASNAAYQFFWHEFCDWYIEWIKPHLNEDQPNASAKKGLLLQRICEVLELLHPFIPFITEYLWQQIPESVRPTKALVIAPYPQRNEKLIYDDAETKFSFLMEFIGKIRQVRTEMNIEPAKKVRILVKGFSDADLIQGQMTEIVLLTRAETIEFVEHFPAGMHLARGVLKDHEIGIDLSGVIDIRSELERLRKELKKIEADFAQAEKKLSNENFVRNAPPEVVQEQREKFEDLRLRHEKTAEHLKSLEE